MKIDSKLKVAMLCAIPFALLGFTSPQQHPHMKPLKAWGIPFSAVKKTIDADCVPCHNAKRHPEKVDLSSYSAMMKSGVIVPRHPEKSRILAYVDGSKQPRMPFKRPAWDQGKITILRKWIAMGARP